jgi:chromosomal replication initiator protein
MLTSLKEEILKELRKRVDESSYETFCKKFEFEPVGEDSYVIPVPNKFYKDLMEREFKGFLQEAFFKVFGREVGIFFKIVEEKVSPQQEPSQERIFPRKGKLQLNRGYTFENFVVGQSNRFAHAGALAVAQMHPARPNPLFIYGSIGLGKTHLLQAICHALLEKKPQNIIYTSCEEFVNAYISAIKKEKFEQFRSKFRNTDVLVIDDIHFLVDKQGSQEEFFHTFNALQMAQKQIVLSSDSAPKDIPTIQERLLSRFASGVVAKIDHPEYETRIAILKKKAELKGRTVPDEILEYIATNIETNIRELESAINKVIFYSVLEGRMDLELAKGVLSDILQQEHVSISLSSILRVVAEYYNISMEELRARGWKKSSSLARQLAMYLAREYTNYSLKEIGAFFGRKDHATCIYSISKIKNLLKSDPRLKSDLDFIIKKLKSAKPPFWKV